MSTSLLYQAFSVSGVKYNSTEYSGGQVIFHAEVTDQNFQCPKCKGIGFIFKGIRKRLLHMPPLGNKKCFLNLTTHQVQCKHCQHKYWPKLPFLKGKRPMTRSFMRFIGDLMKFSTIKDVADFVGVGWDTVKRIHKEYLQTKYKNISLKEVEYISIDEFAIKKGHEYMTIVTDIKSGQIIHVVEGRKCKDVEIFFKKLKKKLII